MSTFFAPADHPDYPECPDVVRLSEMTGNDRRAAIGYMLDEGMMPAEYDDALPEDVPAEVAERVAAEQDLLFTWYGVGYRADECIEVPDDAPRVWRMTVMRAGSSYTRDYESREALTLALRKQIDYELSLDLPSAMRIEATEVDAASGIIFDLIDVYDVFLRFELHLTTPDGVPYPYLIFFTRATAFSAAEHYMTTSRHRYYDTAEVKQVNLWRNNERMTIKRWSRDAD